MVEKKKYEKGDELDECNSKENGGSMQEGIQREKSLEKLWITTYEDDRMLNVIKTWHVDIWAAAPAGDDKR